MDRDSIRENLRRQPFRPFDLVMNDGRRFTVKHPDFLFVFPLGGDVLFVDDVNRRRHDLNRLLIADIDADEDEDPGPVPDPGVPAGSDGAGGASAA